MYKSIGKIQYSIDNTGHKLIVLVDKGIYDYYRALIPKYRKLNHQFYKPHISVIRKETPICLEFWNKYQDENVEFFYDGIIHFGSIYCWLNIFSTRLENIRLELGLPVTSPYTRPPDTFEKVFHTTIGNIKGMK